MLKEGRLAPNFHLLSNQRQIVSLEDFKGKLLIIVFYPGDWSSVCGSQLALYNEIFSEFQKYHADVVAISVDSIWSHAAYAEQHHLQFSLLSDFEPKGQTAKAYGVYREKEGFADRALFIVDGEGIIRWSYLSPTKINPGAEGILTALENLEGKP